MPSLNPPLLQSLAHPDLGSKIGPVLRALDKHNVDVVASLKNALVIGDSLQVFNPFTQSAPLAVPTDWVLPTLGNGWVNVGSGNASAQYKIDPFGRVTIRGLIKSGTINTTAFTLPVGYRPSGNETFPASANNLFANLAVTSAGAVIPQTGSTTNFSIECSFWADSTNDAPIPPSCFPFDVLWPKSYSPTLVVARCAATDGSNLGQMLPDWTMVTKGSNQFIHIRNLPGLLPGKSYSVTLAAF